MRDHECYRAGLLRKLHWQLCRLFGDIIMSRFAPKTYIASGLRTPFGRGGGARRPRRFDHPVITLPEIARDASSAIPRPLVRHGLRYSDVALWEIHEAFAAQVLAKVAALEKQRWTRDRRHGFRFRRISVGPRQSERRVGRDRAPVCRDRCA
jgi:hypothetical protein